MNRTSLFFEAWTFRKDIGEEGLGGHLLVEYEYSDSHQSYRSFDRATFHHGLDGSLFAKETLVPFLSPPHSLDIVTDQGETAARLKSTFHAQLQCLGGNPPGCLPGRLTVYDQRYDHRDKPLPPRLFAWEVAGRGQSAVMLLSSVKPEQLYTRGSKALIPADLLRQRAA
jgi:hypothetical protein